MRLQSILIASLLVACVGEPPEGYGDETGDGDGNGTGTGSGSGSGSGTGTGTGTPTGSMTATKFLEQINMKICDEAFMCKASFPTSQGGTFAEAFGSSVQACYSDGLASYEPSLVEQQITAGKITFNANDASACISGIAFTSCTGFWNATDDLPAACDNAIVGKVADGGACVTHLECSGEMSYCDETTKKCTVETQQAP